mgnify:FL=1
MRTSYSAIDTYLQCPQRYKFQNIDRIRVPKSREAMFGTLIHDTLRFMFEPSPLFPTLDEVVEYFRAHWPALEIFNREAAQNMHKRLWTADDEKQYFQEGVRMLKNFYEKNAPWNYVVVDLESRFEVTLEDEKTGRTHILAGIIDRIDTPPKGGYEIIDYKTGKKMPSRDTFEKDLQLALYSLGLQKRWPHLVPEEITLSLYFVKHGQKLSMRGTTALAEDAKAHVLKTISDIETRSADGKEFEPMPSALCDWCGYKPICPAWKHLYRKTAEPLDQSEAHVASLIQEFFELKKDTKVQDARIAQIQSEFKAHMEAAGVTRLFGKEGTIAKKTVQRFGYDWDRVRAVLEPLGKWQDVLDADEANLKKILGELPPDTRSIIEEAKSIKSEYVTLSGTATKHGSEDREKSLP